ncbi:MBL fold metallo-hydrolase RNA specificity domain-containing protein [Cryobacterium tagatosivorans]|uniref:MBL fold metallo-hydrolase n=1 Tax=Cryobacterium tagatosivorans TaxID=1259199 RepID=A0A4R8UHD6_9MICO|nr:MBL fold metallo-hydrolase [Cryobacterium tagatosivorans]TFB52562.1 MBL fold metallo-hydrolase [Cryobacterium tagatosivorans]
MAQRSDSALHFLGATDTVTGSRYLVESGDRRVLIDCGLFQGYKLLRDRNRLPFPVPPESIDAVVLTHAHLDHSGYLPALVRDGFTGPIYSTVGTAELCGLVLPDSGHLLEEEASYSKKRGSSRHANPRALYTAEDAVRSLESFRVRDFDQELDLGPALRASFIPAGHILGAAQVRLDVAGTAVHFTGDLGRADDPLMKPPRALGAVDVLVAESTYGDRTHSPADPEEELGSVIRRVARRGGVVLIPAFAVGRSESVLLHLSRLRTTGAIPPIPIYLNSPMAIDASEIYRRHAEEHRLTPQEFTEMYRLATLVHSVDESKLLNLRGGPMVIISASGMLTGGRILHHVMAYGSDRRNAIILTGYQAGGTRGAALLRGDDHLRIYGRDVPIKAEVVALESMSAHADADGVIEWMRAAPRPPAMTYLTHGEPSSADALRLRIKHELGWNARVPEHLESVDPAHPR